MTSGLETDEALAAHPAMGAIGLTVSIIFLLECTLKIASAGDMVQTEDGREHLIRPDPRCVRASSMSLKSVQKVPGRSA